MNIIHVSTRTLEFAYPKITYDIDIISPALELERLSLMQSLVADCKLALNHIYKNIDFENILPRWIMLQFGSGIHFVDPVFPIEIRAEKTTKTERTIKTTKISTYNNSQLAKDLIFFSKHKITVDSVDHIISNVLNLDTHCRKRVQHLHDFIDAGFHLLGHVITLVGIIHTTLVFVPPGLGLDETIPDPAWPNFKIRNETYQKLLFRLNVDASVGASVGASVDESVSIDKANTLIFCLIARYNTLNSHNQQLAVLPAFYAYLQNKHDVQFELMGSPMNCFFPNYCSLFGDIEQYFGSRGNFNNIELARGFYTINPPFDEEIMRSCAENILTQLHRPGPLSVLFIIPVWDDPLYGDNQCAVLLKESPFLSAIERIEKKRAMFFDHYLRKYITPCDIFMILVQNLAGKRQHKLNLTAAVSQFFPSKKIYKFK